jgi:hypothetical protein
MDLSKLQPCVRNGESNSNRARCNYKTGCIGVIFAGGLIARFDLGLLPESRALRTYCEPIGSRVGANNLNRTYPLRLGGLSSKGTEETEKSNAQTATAAAAPTNCAATKPGT